MSNEKIKIAIAQMCSVDSVEDNFPVIENLINKAKGEEAEIIFFPENCLYMRLDKSTIPPYLKLKDKVIDRISQLALELKIAVHLGGVGVSDQANQFNASIFIREDGSREIAYRKQKLFDIDLPGKHSYRESDAYDHGSSCEILKWKGWVFGQSICYDLRFSEIYNEYALKKVDALLIPSSFLVPTGEAHWHILNRSRAIESQAYVISSAQAGDHKGRHKSFGHSLVVDPWGNVLVDLENQTPGLACVELVRARIDDVRSKMPMR